MDITGGVFFFLRHKQGKLFHQGNREIAGISRRASEDGHVIELGMAFCFNGWSGGSRNKTGSRLGSRKSCFEIEHGLQRGSIGKDLLDGLRAKQRVKQVHALSVITPVRERKRFPWRLAGGINVCARTISLPACASKACLLYDYLNALEDDGNPLAYTDAHGAKRIFPASP